MVFQFAFASHAYSRSARALLPKFPDRLACDGHRRPVSPAQARSSPRRTVFVSSSRLLPQRRMVALDPRQRLRNRPTRTARPYLRAAARYSSSPAHRVCASPPRRALVRAARQHRHNRASPRYTNRAAVPSPARLDLPAASRLHL
eukprot:872007-Pleurochrysis_carterae.AAC.1